MSAPLGFLLSIDVGTSNTVAALRQPDGKVRPLQIGGATVAPSGVFLDHAGQLVAGGEGQAKGAVDPARYEPYPKQRVGEQAVLLGDREMALVDLLATVLVAAGKSAVEAATFLPPVILTHPAGWGPAEREALLAAAGRAGFPPVRLVPEPIAAAHYYADVLRNPVPAGQPLAVVDLGGGTLDVAVVRREGSGFTLSATGGAVDLGGLDLDAAIAGALGDRIAPNHPAVWQAVTEPQDDEQLRTRKVFWDQVRTAKETLATADTAQLVLPAGASLELTREELDRVVAPLLERVTGETSRVLEQAGVRPAELAGLFLLGGSARLPAVAKAIQTRLGVVPTVVDDPELPVAEGALAVFAPVADVMPVSASGPPAAVPPASAPPASAPPASAPPASVPPVPAPFTPPASAPPVSVPPVSVPPGSGLPAVASPESAPITRQLLNPSPGPLPPSLGAAAGASAPAVLPASPAPSTGDGQLVLANPSGPPFPVNAGGPPVPSYGPVGPAVPPFSAPPAGGPRIQPVPERRRRRWLIPVAVLVVVLLVVGLGVGYLALKPADDDGPGVGANSTRFVSLQHVGPGLMVKGGAIGDEMYTAASDKRAYFGRATGKQVTLAAVDLGNGSAVWGPKTITAASDAFAHMLLAGNHLVLISYLDAAAGYSVVVVNATTGSEQWRTRIHDAYVPANVDFAANTMVVWSQKETLLQAFDLDNGTMKWRRVIATGASITPVQSADEFSEPLGSDGEPDATDISRRSVVYLNEQGRLTAIDAATGKVKSNSSAPATSVRDLLAVGNDLYVVDSETNSYQIRRTALNKLDFGKPIATVQRTPLSGITLCGKHRVCVLDGPDDDAQVAAFDTEKGGEVWREPATGARKLISVGDSVLAVNPFSGPVSYLFDAKGKQLLSDGDKKRLAVRASDGGVLLFDGLLTNVTGVRAVKARGVDPATGRSTELGELPAVVPAACSWTKDHIACAGPRTGGSLLALWKFTR